MKTQIAYSQRSTDVVRSLVASIVFAAGLVLSGAALGDNSSLVARNEMSNASPGIGAGIKRRKRRQSRGMRLGFRTRAKFQHS